MFPSHYNPVYGVKDEPLRPEYYPSYYSDLVNPYAHMGGRKEKKRKHHDSIPGTSIGAHIGALYDFINFQEAKV